MPSLPPRFSLTPTRQRRSGWSYDRTAADRGYGREWRKLREIVLAREPLCRACRSRGHVTAAAEVDHITPKALGGTDAETNLQPLCAPCHRAKTAEDNRRMRIDASHHVPRPRR